MDKKLIKVLIVDDHGVTRDLVKSIIRGIGLTNIEQAENGLIALSKLEEGGYSLIICDWNMPNMSGIELLRKVRSEVQTKAIPFLMLTAEAYRENVAEAVQAGVSDYIAKPFTADELNSKIISILKGKLS